MQKIATALVISLVVVVAMLVATTVGTTISSQKAFAGTSNAQGQCYASTNNSFHSSQISGESVKDTRDANCPPPVGQTK